MIWIVQLFKLLEKSSIGVLGRMLKIIISYFSGFYKFIIMLKLIHTKVKMASDELNEINISDISNIDNSGKH